MEVTEINLADPGSFVDAVPHEWFAYLRREIPVQWHPDPDGSAEGFWSVTRFDDCVGVNRDYEHFSSYRAATLFHDFDEEVLGQQRMMMLNMDPPMHTRYRRLVNKGFTPRMIRDLEVKVVAATDAILDTVCEQGSADFVEQISAELPLQVIADLMGVPQDDRHLVFDWSNRMVGSDDPEYQLDVDAGAQASMELFAYADELCEKKRLDPHEDLFSVLTQAEVEGDKLSQLELDLFFMLLAVAGNETTRNLISGAMVAFFDQPDQWERLGPTARSSPRPSRRCSVSSRRSCTSDGRRRPTSSSATRRSPRVTRWCSGTSRPTGTSRCSPTPTRSTSPAAPTTTWPSAGAAPTSAWGPIWPGWRSG